MSWRGEWNNLKTIRKARFNPFAENELQDIQKKSLQTISSWNEYSSQLKTKRDQYASVLQTNMNKLLHIQRLSSINRVKEELKSLLHAQVDPIPLIQDNQYNNTLHVHTHDQGLQLPILQESSLLWQRKAALSRTSVLTQSATHQSSILGEISLDTILSPNSDSYVVETRSKELLKTSYGQGALFSFSVDMIPSWANALSLIPFSVDGMEIVQIEAKNLDGEWISLQSEPLDFTFPITVSFPAMVMSELRCSLIQRNAMLTSVDSDAFYLYRYGIDYIDLQYRTYGSQGETRIRPISLPSSMAVSIASEEDTEHGTIEYDVNTSSGYHPICPANHKRIREKLFFTIQPGGNHKTNLRMTPASSVTVYEDNEPIQANVSGDEITIDSAESSSVYHAEYEPTDIHRVYIFPDQYKVQEENREIIREQSVIELTNIPHVDRIRLYDILDNNLNWDPSVRSNDGLNYCPIQVEIETQAGVVFRQPERLTKQSDVIYNRTDYLNEGIGFQGIGWEYRVSRNRIYFSKPIPRGATIYIQYPTNNPELSIHITLHSGIDTNRSPVVDKLYAISHNTIGGDIVERFI